MENQELTPIPEKKTNNKWLIIVVFLFATLVFSIMAWMIVSEKKELKTMNEALLKEQSLNSNCLNKKDAFEREVLQLSIYKALTKAMVSRDEATSLLKYKVGDFVYLKSDSAKAVISDILIGGSKYEYYIRYKLILKDNSTREYIPELIY